MKKIKFSNDLLKCYKDFLDNGKTERECVSQIVDQAQAYGYKNIEDCETLQAGSGCSHQKSYFQILS